MVHFVVSFYVCCYDFIIYGLYYFFMDFMWQLATVSNYDDRGFLPWKLYKELCPESSIQLFIFSYTINLSYQFSELSFLLGLFWKKKKKRKRFKLILITELCNLKVNPILHSVKTKHMRNTTCSSKLSIPLRCFFNLKMTV